MTHYLLVDFETTGLLSKLPRADLQPGIVQIGALVVDELGQEIRRYGTLINPEFPDSAWGEDAIKTHGINPDKVADQPTFFAQFDEFAGFCIGADAWVGYNYRFDKDVLAWQLKRYGLEQEFPWPPKSYDVMERAARRMEMKGRSGTKNPTLSEAYEAILGKKHVGAHDALDDILATAELWDVLK